MRLARQPGVSSLGVLHHSGGWLAMGQLARSLARSLHPHSRTTPANKKWGNGGGGWQRARKGWRCCPLNSNWTIASREEREHRDPKVSFHRLSLHTSAALCLFLLLSSSDPPRPTVRAYPVASRCKKSRHGDRKWGSLPSEIHERARAPSSAGGMHEGLYHHHQPETRWPTRPVCCEVASAFAQCCGWTLLAVVSLATPGPQVVTP